MTAAPTDLREDERAKADSGTGAKSAFLARAERNLQNATAGLSAARMACNRLLMKSIKAYKKSDWKRAATFALDATRTDPTSGQAFHMLALGLENVGEIYRAFCMYERAYKLDPSDADLYLNLGLAAWRLGLFDGAERMFRLYNEMRPDSPNGWNNLAGILRDKGLFEEAIETARSAIYRMPDAPNLWNTLGTIMAELCEFEQANTFYAEALRLDPKFARAYHNRAFGLNHTGPLEDALAHYELALRHTADERDRLEASHARGLCLAGLGRLEEGFAAYEARHHPRFKASLSYAVKASLWRGEDLAGKKLLVVCEQGLGDEIMFANVLPDLLRALGPDGELCIASDRRLVPLFARSFAPARCGFYRTVRHNAKDVRLVPWADEGRPIDFFMPLGNALTQLRTRVDDFPRETFLKPDPGRVAACRAQLAEFGPGPYVGFGWRSMLLTTQRKKYFSAVDAWAPVLRTEGPTFVNIQYGDCAEEIARAERVTGVRIHAVPGLDLKNDLEGAAALSAACDLAISAPTAAAALAAAVGTETWFVTAGRVWPQLGTDHYPWYRASRVFHPAHFGDWNDVMPKVAAALAARSVGREREAA